jgi:hypothetical protein
VLAVYIVHTLNPLCYCARILGSDEHLIIWEGQDAQSKQHARTGLDMKLLSTNGTKYGTASSRVLLLRVVLSTLGHASRRTTVHPRIGVIVPRIGYPLYTDTMPYQRHRHIHSPNRYTLDHITSSHPKLRHKTIRGR